MRLLGAKVHPVSSGTGTLKDAVSETMREWTNRISDTHYVLGSVMGPHPFPTIVRDFQAVISKEIKEQCLEAEGKLPDAVLACVGGGSNAIGTFYHFIEDQDVASYWLPRQQAGEIDTFETAATIATGKLGIFPRYEILFSVRTNTARLHRYIPFQRDLIIRVSDRSMHGFMTQEEQNT